MIEVERRFRHKQRGTTYTLIGVGRAQGSLTDDDPVVLYRGEDGGLWVRHQAEFGDGRFEEVAALTGGVTQADVGVIARAIEQRAADDWANKIRDNWTGYAEAAIEALAMLRASQASGEGSDDKETA